MNRWWHVLPTLLWVPIVLRALRGSDHNDFSIFYDAAVAVRTGAPLYEAGYMYPPFFAWLVVPLTLLPVQFAGALWAFAKVPVFYASVGAFIPRDVTPQLRRNLLVLAPFLVFRFLESDLANGNSNVYLLGGVALAYSLCRRGRDRAGGLVAGAVAAVKLSPLYLVAPLFLSGRRVAAGALVVATIVLVTVSSLPIHGGLEGTWRGFTGTSASVFDVPELREDDPHRGYLPGQSLRAIVHRWCTDSDATAHDNKRVTINVVTLSAETAERIYMGTALVVAILGAALMRGRTLAWSLAWGLAILLLVSPYSRKAHFLMLVPGVVMVLTHIVADPAGRRFLIGSFAVYFASGHLTARHIVGRENSYLVNGAGATFVAAVAILSAMWIIRRRESALTTGGEAS